MKGYKWFFYEITRIVVDGKLDTIYDGENILREIM